jgi:hypothetical protein
MNTTTTPKHRIESKVFQMSDKEVERITRILFEHCDQPSMIDYEMLSGHGRRLWTMRTRALLLALLPVLIPLGESAGESAGAAEDDVDQFLADVKGAVLRARLERPTQRDSFLDLLKEIPQVYEAATDNRAPQVRVGTVQVAAMAARLALEGDSTVAAARLAGGLDPLTSPSQRPEASERAT